MKPRIIRLPEVLEMTGLSKSTVYRLMAHDGRFPRSVKLGERATGWKFKEVRKWCDSRQPNTDVC